MRSKKRSWVLVVAGAGAALASLLASRCVRRQLVFEATMSARTHRSMWGLPKRFTKRILRGPDHLAQELDFLLNHAGELRAAFGSGRVSRSLAERIMVAVTGVNGCRYCSYVHARSAIQHGITEEEIARLLDGDLGQVAPSEAVALAFAVNYAETGGRPEPETVTRLQETYGTDAAEDILMVVRAIMLANLLGNTADAFVSRIRGRPAEGSSLASELATWLLFVAAAIPYGVALGLRLLVAASPESSRRNVFVLQP